MKILLLQPIIPKKILWGKYEKGAGFVPPIGLISIGAYIKKLNYDVDILDTQVEMMDENCLYEYFSQHQYDIVGISTFTNSISYSYETAEICKLANPKCKIVFGGVHATVMPEKTFQECRHVDYIVIGEGEEVFGNLLKTLKNNTDISKVRGLAYRCGSNIIINKKNNEYIDLNEIPLPSYELIPMDKYIPHPTQYKLLPNYPVVIQRGCPYKCAFCDAHAVHGRNVRFKSVDYVLDELNLLSKKYYAKGVYFQDSTFIINKEYTIELLNRIIEKKINIVWACNTRVDTVDSKILGLMKKSGCWMIAYGIESGNQKSLDLMRKNTTIAHARYAVTETEKQGISALCSYILAIPKEDYRDSLKTIDFSLELKSTMAMYYLPVPYPGTDLIKICEVDGGLSQDIRWEDYSATDFSKPVYVNPLIGKNRMLKLLNIAYKKYYINFSTVLRNIKKIDTFEDFKRYYRAARAVFNV